MGRPAPAFPIGCMGTADRQNRAGGFERAIDPEAGAPCRRGSMSCSGGLCPDVARAREAKEGAEAT